MNYLHKFESFNFESQLEDLYKLKGEVIGEIQKYKKFEFPEITISISDLRHKDNKIALYRHPMGDAKHGVLSIHPQALGDKEYLRWILVHELIHATFPKTEENIDEEPHHKEFRDLATKMGLPQKYWD